MEPKCKVTVNYTNGLSVAFGEMLRDKDQFLVEETNKAVMEVTVHDGISPADVFDRVFVPLTNVMFIQVGNWSTPSGLVVARNTPNLNLQ